MITPDHEAARPGDGPGFADAVTFAWAAPAAGLYGLARLALGGDGTASALAVLLHGGEPVAAVARGGIDPGPRPDFARLDLGSLAATVRRPLREWTVTFDGGAAGFELDVAAASTPVEVDAAEPLARAVGMVGYEQLCRVEGRVRAGGAEHAVSGLGQRSHLWGTPDWDGIESTRTVSGWLDDGTGVTVTSARRAGARGHDTDPAWGALLDGAGSLHVDEPRLSTTYDGEGRQRRAGLELWTGEGEYPRRAAGEVVCGSTFDLGELRLDCAFLTWHMDGRSGAGRYDLVRRA